jgi:hypothetical protein
MLEWNACQGLADTRGWKRQGEERTTCAASPRDVREVYKPQPAPSLIAGLGEHIV